MTTKTKSRSDTVRRTVASGAEFSHRRPADEEAVRRTFPRSVEQVEQAVRELQEALRSAKKSA